MQVFLVGGAVRDKRLGIPVKDRDWVVVGATPARMLDAGYQPVGRDFPVFLHPHSKEEYALARTERKSGKGYTGFICYSGEDVSLEDDLRRRDLTINAMAERDDGTLVDPYGGLRDLDARLLRHVSEAFTEDPLRVLRVARFLARYGQQGFSVADETMALMRTISNSGELEHLTAERVWQETEKALCEPMPALYFSCLRDCGALKVILPELDALWGIPQPEKHHPEIDSGVHTLLALEQARHLADNAELARPDRIALLFSVLLHDLGKALTPTDEWPSHPGHEAVSAHLAERVCNRLKTPTHVRQLAMKLAEFHTHTHRAFELRPSTVMRTLEALDFLRRPSLLTLFLTGCKADACGRTGFEERDYAQADYFLAAADAARDVSAHTLQTTFELRGKALGEELRKRRIDAIARVKDDFVRPAQSPA